MKFCTLDTTASDSPESLAGEQEVVFFGYNYVYGARNGPTPANLPVGLARRGNKSDMLPAGSQLCRSDYFRASTQKLL